MVYQYYKTLERMRELPKQIDFEKVDDRSTDYLTFATKHLMPIPGYHFVYGCSKDTIHTWQYSSLPPILGTYCISLLDRIAITCNIH